MSSNNFAQIVVTMLEKKEGGENTKATESAKYTLN